MSARHSRQGLVPEVEPYKAEMTDIGAGQLSLLCYMGSSARNMEGSLPKKDKVSSSVWSGQPITAYEQ